MHGTEALMLALCFTIGGLVVGCLLGLIPGLWKRPKPRRHPLDHDYPRRVSDDVERLRRIAESEYAKNLYKKRDR